MDLVSYPARADGDGKFDKTKHKKILRDLYVSKPP